MTSHDGPKHNRLAAETFDLLVTIERRIAHTEMLASAACSAAGMCLLANWTGWTWAAVLVLVANVVIQAWVHFCHHFALPARRIGIAQIQQDLDAEDAAQSRRQSNL